MDNKDKDGTDDEDRVRRDELFAHIFRSVVILTSSVLFYLGKRYGTKGGK